MTGNKYGRLSVLQRSTTDKRKWCCVCDCGSHKEVFATHISRGNTKSCGCFAREVTAKRNVSNAKHGKWRTREFIMWMGMIQRCTDQNSDKWRRYGGRGIRVCKEWMDSFEVFLSFMGERPSPIHSLDRIDNERGYEPGNVRWATPREQANNRSNTIFVLVDGEQIPISIFADKCELSTRQIMRRIAKGVSAIDLLPKNNAGMTEKA